MLRKTGMLFSILVMAALVFAAFAILTSPDEAPLPDQERSYVISNVRVLDVEAGSFGPPTSVGIENGLITDIGADAALPGAMTVDASGRFLVPGFWDMHMHSFQLSPQLHFPLFVANGVTNVRDMMDCPEITDSLIACVDDKRRWSMRNEEGKMAAPRFVEVASFYFEQPEMMPDEVWARAREYKKRGIDDLKIYNHLSPEAYEAAALAAKRLDMRLVGHLPRRVSLTDAIDSEQVSFEHARLFIEQCSALAETWRNGALDDLEPVLLAESMVRDYDPELCRKSMAAMETAGVWFVPTHVTREEDARASDGGFVNDPRLDYLDPLSRWAYGDDLNATVARYPGKRGENALMSYYRRGLELTGEAHRAGVNVLIGTDTVIGGFRYHDEMVHLVSAGLSPAEILRAGTIDAARYAGLEAESGSIAVGKRADLVLLAANPLADIHNSRKIEAVWLAGRLYNREGLDGLLAFTKYQAGLATNSIRLLWGFAMSKVSGEL